MSLAAIEVVILAAGQGTRMKSSTVKILHKAAGRPIIDYVLDLAASITERLPVLVIGHQRETVRDHCGDRAEYAVQEEQLGTGHAVVQAVKVLAEKNGLAESLLVLSGDVPLTRPATVRSLLDEHENNSATLLSMMREEPAAYGRIVRDAEGNVLQIVEAKDATPEQKLIREVNGGIYLFRTEDLRNALNNLSTDNAQGEYYLTDVISWLRQEGKRVGAVIASDPVEALGVNSRAELALVEAELTRRHVQALMSEGVTFRNPDAVMIDTTVHIGPDTIVYPFTTFEGDTRIGRDCVIESGSHLSNVRIGDRVHIKTGTRAEDASISDDSSVGPFANLRPGTVLGRRVKVGNFVETKKANVGEGAKLPHLSYIGDAEIGRDVNVGAGTITCNYDGVTKNKTVIEDGAFIGSDSQLVAPVTIGRGAYVGAGSTITKDVPPDSLALTRSPQKVVAGWAARRREEIARQKTEKQREEKDTDGK